MKVRTLNDFFFCLDTGGMIEVPKHTVLNVGLNDLAINEIPITYDGFSGTVRFLPVEVLEAETVKETDMLLCMFEPIKKYKKVVCWKGAENIDEETMSGYLLPGEDYAALSWKEKRVRSILYPMVTDVFSEAKMTVFEVVFGSSGYKVVRNGKVVSTSGIYCLEDARDDAVMEMESDEN